MPCPQTLTEIIKQPATVKNICVREIVFTMASYNIGAVAEKSYTNGVIGFDGKVYMLVDEFEKDREQRSENLTEQVKDAVDKIREN